MSLYVDVMYMQKSFSLPSSLLIITINKSGQMMDPFGTPPGAGASFNWALPLCT